MQYRLLAVALLCLSVKYAAQRQHRSIKKPHHHHRKKELRVALNLPYKISSSVLLKHFENDKMQTGYAYAYAANVAVQDINKYVFFFY